MNIESIVNTLNKTGTLNINFPGQWFIVDSKVKIHIDGKLHSTHSIKNGFSVSIPITENEMQVQVVLGSIKSTMYKLTGLDKTADYNMKLIYSDTWGKFSKDYKLTNISEPETVSIKAEAIAEKIEPTAQPIHTAREVDKKKWYNSKFNLAVSLLFWPAFVYGFYRSDIIYRKNKAWVTSSLVLLVIMGTLITKHNESLAYIRITHKHGTFDACYVIIPKKNTNYCFHIAVFSANPEMAKALNNPKLSSTCYEVMRTGAPTTEDYNDIFDAIEDGLGDRGCWQPLSPYYSVVDGELYENGVKLTDYLEKNGVNNKIQ